MKKIKKNLKWITIFVVMIILLGGGIIKIFLFSKKSEDIVIEELGLQDDEEILQDKLEEKEVVEVLKKVYVDIKGAVKKPGVYEIEENKKVIDVVEMAGGFTKNADTSMINLAKKVANEMVIIIYTDEEVKQANEDKTVIKVIEKECVCPEIKNDACLDSKDDQNNNIDNKEENISGKININIATIEELQNLTGIGESKAKAIIEYREINGNFQKIEDLMEVSGIGELLYEKIKDNITI